MKYCVICGLKGPWEGWSDICSCCGCHFEVDDVAGEYEISPEFSLEKLLSSGKYPRNDKERVDYNSGQRENETPIQYSWGEMRIEGEKYFEFEDLQAVKEYRKRWINCALNWQNKEDPLQWFDEYCGQGKRLDGWSKKMRNDQMRNIPKIWQ